MSSLYNKIDRRIKQLPPGSAFSKSDFLDLASVDVVRQAFCRLEKKGTIRRVLRGIYDLPLTNSHSLESMDPDLDQVALAVARKFDWHIRPTGNDKLAQLGVLSQGALLVVYFSDGRNKTYKIGGRELIFCKIDIK